MEGNRTLLTEFVLRGITDSPELQVPLFLVFFFIYVITMVGNLGLIFLIWKDPHLHTPMYLFLGNLAYSDACTSSSVTPKMLMKFINKNDMISLVLDGGGTTLDFPQGRESQLLFGLEIEGKGDRVTCDELLEWTS
ncbi:Olfactory receptor 5AC1 [Microtus ochrogaster]|uniref:Olfactory receptor 5AC1 n=1 Tax=Microtus ochrogaster TaxID=79684 RepID=A0A8J6KJ40_MICOH|nr:Olfactory receptor 5AC1 [Microtus ochrogaster]